MPTYDHDFRENGNHYNGGPAFFGYGYQAADEPRLSLIRRWYRQGDRRGQSEDHLFVDGEPVADYDAAKAALSMPVQFTPEEIAALALIGDEPSDVRKIIDCQIRHKLAAKGAAAYGPPGRMRRTDVGRQAQALACSAVDDGENG